MSELIDNNAFYNAVIEVCAENSSVMESMIRRLVYGVTTASMNYDRVFVECYENIVLVNFTGVRAEENNHIAADKFEFLREPIRKLVMDVLAVKFKKNPQAVKNARLELRFHFGFCHAS